MQKKEIIEFFDRCAPQWDAEMIRDDNVIDIILDNANVQEGCDVLDVACGTGVLIPDYLARNIGTVTAIDISPEMIKIAKEKFQRPDVHIICGDVETAVFRNKFDSIVVYNAFPHFADPENLIKILASHLKQGGALTIAHGMSKEQINACHAGSASKVSKGLMDVEDLADIMSRYLNVTIKISNDKMYQAVGILE